MALGRRERKSAKRKGDGRRASSRCQRSVEVLEGAAKGLEGPRSVREDDGAELMLPCHFLFFAVCKCIFRLRADKIAKDMVE